MGDFSFLGPQLGVPSVAGGCGQQLDPACLLLHLVWPSELNFSVHWQAVMTNPAQQKTADTDSRSVISRCGTAKRLTAKEADAPRRRPGEFKHGGEPQGANLLVVFFVSLLIKLHFN